MQEILSCHQNRCPRTAAARRQMRWIIITCSVDSPKSAARKSCKQPLVCQGPEQRKPARGSFVKQLIGVPLSSRALCLSPGDGLIRRQFSATFRCVTNWAIFFFFLLPSRVSSSSVSVSILLCRTLSLLITVITSTLIRLNHTQQPRFEPS